MGNLVITNSVDSDDISLSDVTRPVFSEPYIPPSYETDVTALMNELLLKVGPKKKQLCLERKQKILLLV